MSTKGYILAVDSKEFIFLGKLIKDADGKPANFWIPDLTDQELGQMVVKFLAKHLSEQIIVIADHVACSMDDFEQYRRANADYGDPNFYGFPRRQREGSRNRDAAAFGGARREKAEGEGENEADGPGSTNE